MWDSAIASIEISPDGKPSHIPDHLRTLARSLRELVESFSMSVNYSEKEAMLYEKVENGKVGAICALTDA